MYLRATGPLALALAMVALPAVAQARDGRLTLRSRPSGATIIVGGSSLGETPKIIQLPAGKHVITFRLQGYLDNTQTVQVRGGQTAALYVRLVRTGLGEVHLRDDVEAGPAPGKGLVTVVTDPGGLTLTVNGTSLSRPTPVSFDLDPGSYSLGIKYQDIEVLATQVVVKAGAKVEVRRTVRAAVAAARRRVDPPGGGGRSHRACSCPSVRKLKACVEKRRECKLRAEGGTDGAYALCYSCRRFRRLKKRQRGAAEAACDTRTARPRDCVCRDIRRVVESCLKPQEECLRRCGRD